MSGRKINVVENVIFSRKYQDIKKKQQLDSVFTFTEAFFYATVGQILFLKPYRKFFSNNFCGYLLLMITHQTLTTRLFV